MKKACFLMLLSMGVYAKGHSQTVYFVDDSTKADVRVYVVNNASEADLLVYKVASSVNVNRHGLMYECTDATQAEMTVYRASKAKDAEIKIAYVDSEALAGWKNRDKARNFKRKKRK